MWTPKTYPLNLQMPKHIHFFLETLKNNEIQNFEPKFGLSLRMYENIRVPPPPLGNDFDIVSRGDFSFRIKYIYSFKTFESCRHGKIDKPKVLKNQPDMQPTLQGLFYTFHHSSLIALHMEHYILLNEQQSLSKPIYYYLPYSISAAARVINNWWNNRNFWQDSI